MVWSVTRQPIAPLTMAAMACSGEVVASTSNPNFLNSRLNRIKSWGLSSINRTDFEYFGMKQPIVPELVLLKLSLSLVGRRYTTLTFRCAKLASSSGQKGISRMAERIDQGSDSSRQSLAAGLVVLGALSRILPHPPNMTSVGAMGLFSG